jgi:hypothetical protein
MVALVAPTDLEAVNGNSDDRKLLIWLRLFWMVAGA